MKVYEVLEYVTTLREEQKESPAPGVLRLKMNDLVCRLYIEGYTCLNISRLLSLGKCTVYKILHRNNVFKKQDRSIPRELEEKAICMYRQGKEAREIAGCLNISIPSVRWILLKNNIPPHRPRIIVKKEKPDEKTLEKAVAMYQKNTPYKVILAETGINHSQLYDAIHRSCVPMRDGRVIKSKERISTEEEAIRLYRDTNAYIREIQEKTGIGASTLTRLLKKRNIPLRGKPELKEEQIEEAIRLYHERWTNKAIYEKTGVSPGGLTWILKSRNIPLKGRRQSAIDKDAQEKVVRMYQKGYPLKEIRKETGVRDIYDVLNRYGISDRRHPG